MSKSLEALKKLLDLITIYSYWVEAHSYCNTIKQDLERLEHLEKENQELKKEYETLDRAYNSCHLDYEDLKGENENLTKAINLLKTNYVAITLIISTNNVEEYNALTKGHWLTQQEYELLKEVLGE